MRLIHLTFIVPTVWNYSGYDYSRGIDRNFTGYPGYYHGVSPGASENNLVNYYYSQDTREFFLREEEQAHVNKKNSKKLTNNKQ